jgi:hypothetical protein
MTVYILIREDQNQHGFIDTSIAGVFHNERDARSHEAVEQEEARDQGQSVYEPEDGDPDWQVSWKVEAHEVF